MAKRKRDSKDYSTSSSSSSSSSSSDDRHHKREKKHKKDRKKHKKSKSRKKEKKSKRDKRAKEALEFIAKHKGLPNTKISDDDYFRYNSVFRRWLKEERGTQFDELTSGEARAKFSKFTRRWNDGELPGKYYGDEGLGRGRPSPATGGAPVASHPSDIAGSRAHMDTFEREELEEREQRMRKAERKAERKKQQELLDELVPRPDPGSFAARMEKRREKAPARGGRGDSPEYSERDMMGGGDDFKMRVARMRNARIAKETKRIETIERRANAAAEKEKARMDSLKAALGFAGDAPIAFKIPERHD